MILFFKHFGKKRVCKDPIIFVGIDGSLFGFDETQLKKIASCMD